MAEKVSEGVRRLSLVLGLLGLIPWGVVRVIAWIVAGFMKAQDTE